MKVIMLVGMAGNNFSLSPGDEYAFPDDEAVRLIDAGFAKAAVGLGPDNAGVKADARGKRGKDVDTSDSSGSSNGTGNA